MRSLREDIRDSIAKANAAQASVDKLALRFAWVAGAGTALGTIGTLIFEYFSGHKP